MLAQQKGVDADITVRGEGGIADCRVGGAQIHRLGADDSQRGEVVAQRVDPIQEDPPGDDGELTGVDAFGDFGHGASRSPRVGRDAILELRLPAQVLNAQIAPLIVMF